MKDLVVVLTGGCRGIGLSIAENFLARGATVIIADLSKSEAAENLLRSYSATASFIHCDVTTDLERVYADIIGRHSRVNVLINNAGIGDERSPKRLLELNTIAVIEWTQRFYDHMRTDTGGKGGTIINIASIYGYRMDAFMPIYKASKHAVVGFTRTIGHQQRFNKLGVRVVAVCPGHTRTELVNVIPNPDPMYEVHVKMLDKMIWQEAEAVGKAVIEVYEKADSGSTWQVEGGLLSEVNFPFTMNY